MSEFINATKTNKQTKVSFPPYKYRTCLLLITKKKTEKETDFKGKRASQFTIQYLLLIVNESIFN